MRHLALVLSICMLVCLAACGSGAVTYTMFAYDMDGYIQEAVGISSEMTLKSSGAGHMTINGEGGSVRWTDDDGAFVLTAGEDTMTGTISDGIIALSVGEDAVWYYAAEGADTSAVPVLTQEEYYRALMGQ